MVRQAPEISVIMPTWKSAEYISTAIKSVQAQKDVRWELIVVDDASPDNTLTVACALAESDPRIKLDALEKNSGPAAARNRAIDLSRAPFVAVLDDDDTMDPSRLRTLIDLAEMEKADIVVDNMLEVEDRPGGSIKGKFLNLPGLDGPAPISFAEYLDPRAGSRFGGSLGYLKPVFRRSTLNRRYDETLRNSEDFYFVASLLATGAKMVLTAEPLYLYTRRRESLSWRLSADDANCIVDAHRDLERIFRRKMTEDELKASKMHLKQRRDRLALALLVDKLKARQFGQATAHLFSRPFSLPFISSEAARILRDRLGA